MKNILFTVSACCAFLTVFAQKPEPAIGRATYEFIHIRDTTKSDKPFKETMSLLVGRNASVYKSLSKQQEQEALDKQIDGQVKSAVDPNKLSLTITGGGVHSDEEYYQFINDKKLFIEDQVVNYYLTEEALPVIKWHIQKDTMSFGALHAQKATTHFKGRDYEAWFCSELPFRTGPWQLNGLPGLILQAMDSKKEVMFNFKGFEDVSDKAIDITLPKDDIKTTVKDLAHLKEIRIKDPQGFAKATQGSGQQRMRSGNKPFGDIDPSRIASINVNKSTNTNSAVINNPIELREQKEN
ncbi:GLPGLI family protein [Mucilaginibacter pallidiroseus]|uniref:GLPGLI family protein n=1 Tax=Mucilaginibacter pallidiroseus TaxID=2599295 RepID=A0A563U3F4_9SPHI|nr:GLPGLI family protein [Mucilaginibacter pallidiroseus]TWR25853.1 GLPGLI family protein [Mucilaginibacter pallidiroseus]